MKHKVNRLLNAFCSAFLAWFVFCEVSFSSYLFFGEQERPEIPTE